RVGPRAFGALAPDAQAGGSPGAPGYPRKHGPIRNEPNSRTRGAHGKRLTSTPRMRRGGEVSKKETCGDKPICEPKPIGHLEANLPSSKRNKAGDPVLHLGLQRRSLTPLSPESQRVFHR